MQVAHDGVAGAVQLPAVQRLRLLPVPAGDVSAELVRERGDQRGHHQQRVGVVADPGVRSLPTELLLVHGRLAVSRWWRRVHGWRLCLVAHLDVARRRRAWVNYGEVHARCRVGIPNRRKVRCFVVVTPRSIGVGRADDVSGSVKLWRAYMELCASTGQVKSTMQCFVVPEQTASLAICIFYELS